MREHYNLLSLRHGGVDKYHKLAVVGLGGLGHMAVKIAKAFGTAERKRQDAMRLGAAYFTARDVYTATAAL